MTPRGGPRPRSGRPPIPEEHRLRPLTVRLRPAMWSRLQSLRRPGESLGSVARRLLLAALRGDEPCAP